MNDFLAQLTSQLNQGRTDQLNPDRAIRLPELLTIIPWSRQTIYRKIKRGEFPSPIKLSPNGAVCWRLKTILLWLAEKEIESMRLDCAVH